ALVALRDKRTSADNFRRAATRVSVLLAAEAFAGVSTVPTTVETPIGQAGGFSLAASVIVVPVLRAGLGMLASVLQLLPPAGVGPVGLARRRRAGGALAVLGEVADDLEHSYVVVLDPMLATGGSAVAALDLLRRAGARTIRMICIVAAPEGIALVEQRHPDVL